MRMRLGVLSVSELEIGQLVVKTFLGRYYTLKASSATRSCSSVVVLDLRISSHRYHPNRPSPTRIGPNHSLPAVARIHFGSLTPSSRTSTDQAIGSRPTVPDLLWLPLIILHRVSCNNLRFALFLLYALLQLWSSVTVSSTNLLLLASMFSYFLASPSSHVLLRL
jgi:hypothetical protein